MKTTNFSNGFARLLIANLANAANSANLEGENSAWLMANPANVANLANPANAGVPLNCRAGSVAWRCATVLPGAINTQSEASDLYANEVFSCPKFKVLDVGRAYPQGWLQRFGVVDIPHVHSSALSSQRMVSKFPEGIKTMTTSPRATLRIRTTPDTTPVVVLTNKTLIESALTDALNLVRSANTTQDIQRATGKAIKAVRLLKCACEAIKNVGAK